LRTLVLTCLTACILIGGAAAQNKQSADSLFALARQLQKSSEHQDALREYGAALVQYGELGLLDEKKECLYKMGYVQAARLSDWKSAESTWKEALDLAVALKDGAKVARIKGNLGIVYDHLGDYKTAEEYHRQSLSFYEMMFDARRICITHKNIGMLRLNQSDYYNAEKEFSAAQELAREEQLADELGKLRLNFGLLNYKRGNYGRAFADYREALRLLGKDISDQDRANALSNLGMVYRAYGDTASARKQYEEALEIACRCGDRGLKARVLNNLGNLYRSLGSYDRAIDFLRRSLSIKEEIGDKRGISNTNKNIGDIFVDKGELDRAREVYRISLALNKELGHLSAKASLKLAHGNLFRELGEDATAQQFYGEGIELARRLDANDLLYKLFQARGEHLYDQGRIAEAVEDYRRSITAIENIRQTIGIEENRASFMARILPVYERMIEIQLELGDRETAYDFYEKMKARNLLDILDGAFLVFEDEMTAAEIKEQIDLELELRHSNREIRAYSNTDERSGAIDTLVTRQLKIRQAIKEFREQLYFRHPEIRRKMGSGIPIRSRDAVRLLNQSEAGLAYLVLDDVTICFLLRKLGRREYSIESHEIPVSRDSLGVLISELQRELKPGGDLPGPPGGAAESEATVETCYRLLVEPLRAQLEGMDQLCIIPDSYLHSVPFQALRNPGSGTYLIEEFALNYVYSMSVLDELRAGGTAGKEALIAFGNPELLPESGTDPRGSLPPLHAAEEEARSIGRLFSGKSAVYTGREASESNFKGLAEDYGIVHLATHGLLDEVNPMYSSMLLASDKENDGYLTAREIIMLDLNADLVVLSACDTARGRLSEGEGMLGLSRAFFGAQVPTLVATLWPVADTSTMLLMKAFFERIRDGLRPARALQQAQLGLLNSGVYDDPAFWAPFVLIGDSE